LQPNAFDRKGRSHADSSIGVGLNVVKRSQCIDEIESVAEVVIAVPVKRDRWTPRKSQGSHSLPVHITVQVIGIKRVLEGVLGARKCDVPLRLAVNRCGRNDIPRAIHRKVKVGVGEIEGCQSAE